MELVFSKKMTDAIATIDEVLASFGVPGLLNNPDFVTNNELTLENYLQLELRRNANHVKLVMIISGGDIRFDIDKAEEISEWPLKELQNDRGKFVAFMKTLFTSYVLVEHYGAPVSRISFFDGNGKCIDVYKYRKGLGLKGDREDRLYFPIYPM